MLFDKFDVDIVIKFLQRLWFIVEDLQYFILVYYNMDLGVVYRILVFGVELLQGVYFYIIDID